MSTGADEVDSRQSGPGPAGPGVVLPTPGSIADAFVACVVLFLAVGLGFLAQGGRNHFAELGLVGAGILAAYLAGWRHGRLPAAASTVAYLVIEQRLGRLDRAHYWEQVLYAIGILGAGVSAAYLKLTIETRNRGLGQALERIDEIRERDELSAKLAGGRRLSPLEMELERARRHNHALGLLLIRPDGFEEVRLRYGEHGATAFLTAVAETIGSQLRGSDTALRDSPLDFALILPETDPEGGRLVAERIRLAVSGRRLELGGGEPVDVTVSIGAASFPEDAGSNAELASAAQRALARAVELGGNRTVLRSLPADAPRGWSLQQTAA